MKERGVMWLPFRVPYRWIPRCWWSNLSYIAYDLYRGPVNLARWFKVIWFDRDFDWDFLAEIMEIKLKRLADAINDGHHMHRERDARKCRICAELLKRLRDDEYFENARKTFGKTKFAAQHAAEMGKQDQRYLGLMIGKYFTHWWN